MLILLSMHNFMNVILVINVDVQGLLLMLIHKFLSMLYAIIVEDKSIWLDNAPFQRSNVLLKATLPSHAQHILPPPILHLSY